MSEQEPRNLTTGRPEKFALDFYGNAINLLSPLEGSIQTQDFAASYTAVRLSGITSGIWSLQGFKIPGTNSASTLVNFRYGDVTVVTVDSDPAVLCSRQAGIGSTHQHIINQLFKIPSGMTHLSIKPNGLIPAAVPNVRVVLMKWS